MFEYKQEGVMVSENLTDWLNSQSRQGWRLVCIQGPMPAQPSILQAGPVAAQLAWLVTLERLAEWKLPPKDESCPSASSTAA